ncbi:hypothetical protein DFA_05276 [Cavenderia fasciculata]|uniref:Uncharacterized protein n=1 Tax=Cavenderia fasciculata TaxID=261658 RepID=F4PNU2_CACFS|nr:uncharacterized protein DFA_05276 [Cavenderia fasciculata]EGG23145.1 hypothetical protein DFA_05276 [Cavenderia fasciculata]|eukprot:XP_004360996.1 hypothetical protein DFA_05276 [Cavenderia fasciculata]
MKHGEDINPPTRNGNVCSMSKDLHNSHTSTPTSRGTDTLKSSFVEFKSLDTNIKPLIISKILHEQQKFTDPTISLMLKMLMICLWSETIQCTRGATGIKKI